MLNVAQQILHNAPPPNLLGKLENFSTANPMRKIPFLPKLKGICKLISPFTLHLLHPQCSWSAPPDKPHV